MPDIDTGIQIDAGFNYIDDMKITTGDQDRSLSLNRSCQIQLSRSRNLNFITLLFNYNGIQISRAFDDTIYLNVLRAD